MPSRTILKKMWSFWVVFSGLFLVFIPGAEISKGEGLGHPAPLKTPLSSPLLNTLELTPASQPSFFFLIPPYFLSGRRPRLFSKYKRPRPSLFLFTDSRPHWVPFSEPSSPWRFPVKPLEKTDFSQSSPRLMARHIIPIPRKVFRDLAIFRPPPSQFFFPPATSFEGGVAYISICYLILLRPLF